MEPMCMTWGYLFLILALQALRRRSAAVLPHLAVSAVFPLASLAYDLDSLSLRRTEAFVAVFIGAFLVQAILIYRANRLWAIERSRLPAGHLPAGICGRERLKLVIAGIVLVVAHNLYFTANMTLFALLDRAMFWVLTALMAASAVYAFAAHRHPVAPIERGTGPAL